MPIREAHGRELDERGLVRLEGFIAPERRQRLADRIQEPFEAEGEHAGAEFRQEPGARRLANLVDKGGVFVDCVVEPEVLVTGRAGDRVVMNAHLWHGGTANDTDRPRLALHAFYCRSDKPQQQYQRALLRPETQAALPAAARAVLALALALDDPQNDALSAAGAGRSGFPR